MVSSLLWTFDGSDISGTKLYDLSGNGNNGTLTNGPTPSIGKLGQALTFNGVNQYVNLPSGFANFTSGITVSLWANPTSNGSWARFIDLANGQGNNNLIFERNNTTNNLDYDIWSGGSDGGGDRHKRNY